MPAAHWAHKEWNARAADPLGSVPPSRARLPQLSGLLSLAKRHGPQRVEAACTLALELGAGQCRHVRALTQQPLNGGE